MGTKVTQIGFKVTAFRVKKVVKNYTNKEKKNIKKNAIWFFRFHNLCNFVALKNIDYVKYRG